MQPPVGGQKQPRRCSRFRRHPWVLRQSRVGSRAAPLGLGQQHVADHDGQIERSSSRVGQRPAQTLLRRVAQRRVAGHTGEGVGHRRESERALQRHDLASSGA